MGETNPSHLSVTTHIQSWAGLGERDLQNDPEFFYYVYYNISEHSKTILDVFKG